MSASRRLCFDAKESEMLTLSLLTRTSLCLKPEGGVLHLHEIISFEEKQRDTRDLVEEIKKLRQRYQEEKAQVI